VWWRVYYSDGSVYTSQDGTPFDAPRQDVQVIAQEKDGDYQLAHGRDYFYFEEDRGGFAACDLFSAFDHLVRARRQCLFFGRMLSDSDWRALFARVKEDVGPRSAAYAREYRRDPDI
jgi:hypothetical protein